MYTVFESRKSTSLTLALIIILKLLPLVSVLSLKFEPRYGTAYRVDKSVASGKFTHFELL